MIKNRLQISPRTPRGPEGPSQRLPGPRPDIKIRSYITKLDWETEIWVPKGDQKGPQNRCQKRSDFRSLSKSTFFPILVPKWSPLDPHFGLPFWSCRSFDFWKMSLTKHLLLSFGDGLKMLPKSISHSRPCAVHEKSKKWSKKGSPRTPILNQFW